MNRTVTWVRRMVVGMAVLALTAGAMAQATKDVTAKVTRIKGAARYTTDGQVWQTLKVGQIVKPGTTIQTAADSLVDLVLGEAEAYAPRVSVVEFIYYQPLAEQDAIRIFADSVLALDKLTATDTGVDQVTETQLDLKAGKVFGRVRKLAAASKYEVKIPNGVAGIRGTTFWLSADGVLSVLVGSVVIAYVGPDGTVVTQVVTAGYEFDARTGQLRPLPEATRRELMALAGQVGVDVRRPEVVYPEPIIYVSPTVGTKRQEK